MDFWISDWISGFQSGFLDFVGFLDFRLDFYRHCTRFLSWQTPRVNFSPFGLSLCTEVVSSGGAPTPAGTSVFTKHNWDMGMGYLT